ncbi:MAG TPA: putative sulfate exporter family transporter [Reyranella sp.]|nr:putative sulfate exporter family transporter [Reyranella sp.]
MRSTSLAVEVVRLWAPGNLRKVAAGTALCAVIAAIADMADLRGWTHFRTFFIPPLILTLAIGMALQPLSSRAALKEGIDFSGRTLLRVGVALLGARLTLGQLVDDGFLPVIVALAAVSCTIIFGAWSARFFGLTREFGILTGCATGVCGAAAAMAAAAVLPKHKNADRDLAFAVMGVNFISTVTMVVYPTLHHAMGYSNFEMGVFLGGAIHDVAQVAGAAQTLGPQVLSDAIITKLLRVAFLLPAVGAIAWWVARSGQVAGEARPAPPVFLFGFLTLVVLNSIGVVPHEVQAAVSQVSNYLIILAIAALGMKTSLLAMARIGVPSVALLLLETVFIGLLVVGLIYGLRTVGM